MHMNVPNIPRLLDVLVNTALLKVTAVTALSND